MRRRATRGGDMLYGLGALAVLAVGLALVFGVRPPTGPKTLTLRAPVAIDVKLGKGSPVRIAGVPVGEVTDVQPAGDGRQAGIVTMAIRPEGLPIHADATAKIRPRLLLEGNFFVELRPGTPDAPALRSGAMLPAGAVTGAVQLDRALGTFDQPSRTALRGLLQGFGGALGGGSEPTAGQRLNDALADSPVALGRTTVVTRALQGAVDGDLERLVAGTGRTLDGLGRSPRRLSGLVEHFDRTISALADRDGQLRATVRGLDAVTAAAGPALDGLDASLPPLRTFATDLVPGVRQTPATITATRPWLTQLEGYLAPAELGGLARSLQPAVQNTATGLASLRSLTTELDGLNRCALRQILPTSKKSVQDGSLTTGVPVWTEGLQALAGLGGAAQGFDGNGAFLRGQAGGGEVPVKTSSVPGQGPLFGNAVQTPTGTRPAFVKSAPPVRPDAACASTQAPSLAARTGNGP